MKIHKIHPHYLDKCMFIITEHCFNNPQQAFYGEELQKFCTNPQNVYALHHLASMDELRLVIPDNSTIPSTVFLEKKGILHSYVRREKRYSAVNGFITGVLATIFTGLILPILANTATALLTQWLLQQ